MVRGCETEAGGKPAGVDGCAGYTMGTQAPVLGGPFERTCGALLRIMSPRGKELEYLSTNSHSHWLRLLRGACDLSLECN